MTHKHTWPGDLDCTVIGEGVCLTAIPNGFLVSFENDQTDGWLTGRVLTNGDDEYVKWQQTGTLEGGDLTLSPSIQLDYGQGLSFHGFVTNGKWVSV
jgi:hypothetical protein